MDLGLSLVFGFIVALAAIVTAVTAFISTTGDHSSDTLQIASGVGFTVAMLAASIAVVAIHLFD